MTKIGIGHNRGPSICGPDAAPDPAGMRLYAWKKAHRAAFRAPSVEAMKIRTERANALGLTYREFTAVLLDRGRNATTLFFGFAGVLARRLRPEALMPGVAEKLSAIRPGASFVIENGPAALVESVRALAARCRHAFTRILVDDQRSDMRLPAPGMARHLLAEHARMPGEAVMIGDSVVHEQAAKAAGLGLFIWAWRYLGPKP